MGDQALSERPPTDAEARQASEAARALAGALTTQGLPFSVRKDGDQITVDLPPSVGQLMLDVLTHVARGEMVTFVPVRCSPDHKGGSRPVEHLKAVPRSVARERRDRLPQGWDPSANSCRGRFGVQG